MTLLGIIVGLLPGFIWLVFYLKEDLHPEPKRLIFLTFVVGAVFAYYALIMEIALDSIFTDLGFATLSLIPLILLAFLEEILKFCAAYFTVHKNAEFNEPVDAMIYMVVAAMGFATLENIGAVSSGNISQLALVGDVLRTASLRFIGATLLHALGSAIVGYFWAVSIRDFGLKGVIVKGLIIASLLHAGFNFLIINFGTMVYAIVLLAIAGFFVINDFEKLKRKSV